MLAVAEIHYVDTSGEVIDQSADHRRRLREFEAALRSDLAASGKMANVALECPPNACSVGDIDDGQLLGKAEQAGATHLLIGRFHKMSTLVQQAKFDVIDVKARKIVFDRHITFRGDNDAAWQPGGIPSLPGKSSITANGERQRWPSARQQPFLDRLDLQRQLF